MYDAASVEAGYELGGCTSNRLLIDHVTYFRSDSHQGLLTSPDPAHLSSEGGYSLFFRDQLSPATGMQRVQAISRSLTQISGQLAPADVRTQVSIQQDIHTTVGAEDAINQCRRCVQSAFWEHPELWQKLRAKDNMLAQQRLDCVVGIFVLARRDPCQYVFAH